LEISGCDSGRFLNIHMTEGGDIAIEDSENNENDIAKHSENNEDLEDDIVDCSIEVYIYIYIYIYINSITPIVT
jgi:hypothetical protein